MLSGDLGLSGGGIVVDLYMGVSGVGVGNVVYYTRFSLVVSVFVESSWNEVVSGCWLEDVGVVINRFIWSGSFVFALIHGVNLCKILIQICSYAL